MDLIITLGVGEAGTNDVLGFKSSDAENKVNVWVSITNPFSTAIQFIRAGQFCGLCPDLEDCFRKGMLVLHVEGKLYGTKV